MAQTQPEDFRIDISHEQSFRYLQAKQFDHNSRTRRLIITDNNIPLSFTGKELINLSLYINGDNYSNTTCPFGEDGFPRITFTESMLSREGDVSCEIRIYDSSEATVTTTFTFMMTVSKSLLNHDRLVTSSEFNVLNDLILQANMIPNILDELQLSLETIKILIDQSKDNIISFTNQFYEMKNQYTNDFNILLQQINADVLSYQIDYVSLKSEVVDLKTEVTAWYTAAQEAENTRNDNEEKRQQDTANAIVKAAVATENTKLVTEEANKVINETIEAKDEALIYATYAKKQGDRVDAVIEGLEQAMIDVDGGNAFTSGTDFDDDFDGGEA